MLISIIVPFYKGNKYLNQIERMVKANAENLSAKDFLELIIVNDSPSVPFEEHKFSLIGYSLKVVKNEVNSGIHKARVNGIKAASGDYILMLDQDDLIRDNCIASHMKHIGNADVSVSDGYKRNGAINVPIYGSSSQHNKVKRLFWYLYLENRILSPGQCLIKRTAIPEDWCDMIMMENGADDMLLWVIMLDRKASFILNRDYLYVHVFTGENVSNDELKMSKSTYEMLDIMETKSCCSSFIRRILKRKIINDVYYLKHGKDKYIDYRCIEVLRKMLSRTR